MWMAWSLPLVLVESVVSGQMPAPRLVLRNPASLAIAIPSADARGIAQTTLHHGSAVYPETHLITIAFHWCRITLDDHIFPSPSFIPQFSL
jgi:hypothetical protein